MWCGALKLDLLTVQALDKLHKAVDLLIEHGVIEDKGSIKANYDAYINPEVLDYDSHDMWKMIGENSLTDAFQFDTPMGRKAGAKIKPRNIVELASANSLMRLMPQHGKESPIDTYVRYREDISLWYKEMDDYGLTKDEQHILEPYLLPVYGVGETQEVVMRLVMDENISNFSMKEANKMRKSIAKKDEKAQEEVKLLFYEKGKECNTSNNLLNYVWVEVIGKQLGYSFSTNHTTPYSVICLQELNLAYRYGRLYWNTACLTINAGADEENENSKTTNYGKIAKAIGDISKYGQVVELPNINKSKFGFEPNSNTKAIYFGLKGIQGIGNDIASAIVANQPYKSMDDFLQKMEVYKSTDKENKFGDSAMISLIKSGAFDELENKPRVEIMADFIRKISKPVKLLKFDDIPVLYALGYVKKTDNAFRLYNHRKFVLKKANFAFNKGKSAATAFYRLPTDKSKNFFYDFYETNMKENVDYMYLEDGCLAVKQGSLDREYKKLMTDFKENVLTKEEVINAVNDYKFNVKWAETVGSNNISEWEFSANSFYYHDSELANVNKEDYCIEIFDELPLNPEITEYRNYRGHEIPRFRLCRIVGTILDKDKNKNTITILTPEKTVVGVKMHKGQFGFYDKQISEVSEDGSKTIIEKSWFKRGNKILITGFRSEDQFITKKYKDSAFRHTVQLVKEIREDGSLVLQTDRYGEANEDMF